MKQIKKKDITRQAAYEHSVREQRVYKPLPFFTLRWLYSILLLYSAVDVATRGSYDVDTFIY